MASSRTIESYAEEITGHLDGLSYANLGEVYETLQRMRFSSKLKHELNYWRVLQCLGEMAVDKFAVKLPENEKTSCKCHTFSNLLCLLQLFTEVLCNVTVVKRILLVKNSMIPVFLRAVRQREDPSLVRYGMVALYRCLVAGKADLVELYLKYGLLKDCREQIHCRRESFGIYPIIAVQYCAKLMTGMAELGDTKVRDRIKRSTALRELTNYVGSLRRNKINRDGVSTIYSHFGQLKMLIADEDIAQNAKASWNAKTKLKEELEQEEIFIFCSSPSCRKQHTEKDHFRYCGACRLSRYCSEKCQKDHWHKGHKEKCLKTPSED